MCSPTTYKEIQEEQKTYPGIVTVDTSVTVPPVLVVVTVCAGFVVVTVTLAPPFVTVDVVIDVFVTVLSDAATVTVRVVTDVGDAAFAKTREQAVLSGALEQDVTRGAFFMVLFLMKA